MSKKYTYHEAIAVSYCNELKRLFSDESDASIADWLKELEKIEDEQEVKKTQEYLKLMTMLIGKFDSDLLVNYGSDANNSLPDSVKKLAQLTRKWQADKWRMDNIKLSECKNTVERNNFYFSDIFIYGKSVELGEDRSVAIEKFLELADTISIRFKSILSQIQNDFKSVLFKGTLVAFGRSNQSPKPQLEKIDSECWEYYDFIPPDKAAYGSFTYSNLMFIFPEPSVGNIEHYLLSETGFHSLFNEKYEEIQRKILSTEDSDAAEGGKAPKIQRLSADWMQQITDGLKIAAAAGDNVQTFYDIAHGPDFKIYDLHNDEWEAVICKADGSWEVTKHADIIFLRKPGAVPKPTPVKGGTLSDLDTFLNMDANDKKIVAGFIVYALYNSNKPNPLLEILGLQGSGKSVLTEMLLSCLPGTIFTHRLPSNPDGLLRVARDNYVCAFDNVSKIPDLMSDSLCMLSTGIGTEAKGKITAQRLTRPVVINSIHEVIYRPDLIDRTFKVYLNRIDDEKRIDAERLMENFESAKPRIMGVLFDGVSSAMQNINKVSLNAIPRMADFVKVVTAAEDTFGWEEGQFAAICFDNINASAQDELYNNPLALAVLKFIKDKREPVKESATWWMQQLQSANVNEPFERQLPRNPITLSNSMARIAPILRKGGIDVEIRKSNGGRSIVVSKIEGAAIPDVKDYKFAKPTLKGFKVKWESAPE